MLVELRNMLHGIGLLRHGELVRFLGEERRRRLELAQLRQSAPALRLKSPR